LNVRPVDFDVIVSIGAALFVMEADRVHQFVQNDANHETVRVQRNDLGSAIASDEAAAPAHFQFHFN
jgi:hypothetical protein